MSTLIPDSPVMGLSNPPPSPLPSPTWIQQQQQPSFHQVPFVQINDRIEKGTRCRKRFRKYIETSATIEREMAQSLKADSNLIMILNELDAIPKSSVEETFRRLQEYSVSIANERLDASKILLDSVSSFEHWSRVKKWNHSVYSLVQKAVGEVKTLEKKMEKSVLRHARALEELGHWKSVCEIATATLETNAANSEYQKSHQMTEARVAQALEEEKAASSEYLDSKMALIQSLGRRDELVEQISGISQQLEEDRLDAIIDVLNQWIKTKQRVLETEREALAQVEESIGRLSRQETLQQFISDQHHPKLVHKHTKALHLLEWHFELHQESFDPLSSVSKKKSSDETMMPSLFEQSKNNNNDGDNDPSCQSYITKDIRANDIEVMKNFIASCFCTPEKSHIVKDILAKNMYKYRTRFIPNSPDTIYEHKSVRLILISCLQTQRGRSQELSCPGYESLGMVLECVLSACVEARDIKVAKSVMNMMQTFYVTKKSSSNAVVHLTDRLKRHDIWANLWFWRDALLLGMDEEMSKCPLAHPWYHLPSTERLEEIRKVHNIIYGQLGTLVYNMSSIGIPRVNIGQFVQHVAQSFELPEHQLHQLQKQHPLDFEQQQASSSSSEPEPPLAWSCAHMNLTPSGGSSFSNPQNVSKTTKTLKNIASYLNPFSSLSSSTNAAVISDETSESHSRPSPSSNAKPGNAGKSNPPTPSITASILHNTAEEVTCAWENLFGVEEKSNTSSVAAPPPPDIGNHPRQGRTTNERRRKGSPDPSLQFDTSMGSHTNTKKKTTKTSTTPEKRPKSSTRSSSSSSSGDRKKREHAESSAKTTVVVPAGRIPSQQQDETPDETQARQSNRAAAHSIAQEFHHRHQTRKSRSAANIGEESQKQTRTSRSKSTKSQVVDTDDKMSTTPAPVVTTNESLEFPQGVAAIRARFEKQHL